MNALRVAIGADHRGLALKNFLLQSLKLVWTDVGCFSSDRCDYPVYAERVCQKLLDGHVDRGILICGSGIGMSIAANRYKHVYAGLVCNPDMAYKAREDDNVSVLVLPADYINKNVALECVQRWLAAKFLGGHYAQRLAMIDGK